MDACATSLLTFFKNAYQFVIPVYQRTYSWTRGQCRHLNMPFSELDDPRGMARDVSNVGRWGNGDVSVDLATEEDIPYVVSLIRQSLERQLRETGVTG